MTGSPKSEFKWLEGLVALLLVGVSSAEIVIYSPAVQRAIPRLAVTVKAIDSTDRASSLDLSITHGPADSTIRLVAFPLSDRSTRQRSIFVFDDSDYSTANVDQAAGDVVLYHLAGELALRHYSAAISGLTANGLRDVLVATDEASSRTVVMMTGVWPASVFSRSLDLVTPWVRSGGLVVWGGATIGYWSATAGQPLSLSTKFDYGESGTQLLLGKGVAVYPWVNQRVGTVRSDFATALDISYKSASAGILRDSATPRGGLSLGWYSGQYSSVTYVPLGTGGYLLFGGEIIDPESVSRDLLEVVLSGALAAAGPVAERDVQLNGTAVTSDQRWDLPFGRTNAGIMFIAFDPNPDGTFYYGTILAT